MIDEVRHSTIQQNLKRLYMNNYIDPAGFNNSLRNFQNDYCGTIGRQFAEGFITGDAITAASIYLTIVAETAFTNTLFVAMPAEAAANGDYLLPTVFHSVQSDESRHISNGYATLLMALSTRATTSCSSATCATRGGTTTAWSTPAIGTFIEYGTKDRRKDRESTPRCGAGGSTTTTTAATSCRWRSTAWSSRTTSSRSVEPDLEQGLRARGRPVLRHRLARQLLADRPDDRRGLRVVRVQVPGLVRQYGKWWENYNRLSTPNGHHPIVPRTSTTCTRTAAGPAWSRAWSARTW
jgi:propane monooxygenase large subunit